MRPKLHRSNGKVNSTQVQHTQARELFVSAVLHKGHDTSKTYFLPGRMDGEKCTLKSRSLSRAVCMGSERLSNDSVLALNTPEFATCPWLTHCSHPEAATDPVADTFLTTFEHNGRSYQQYAVENDLYHAPADDVRLRP
jgi:hypothetical protein